VADWETINADPRYAGQRVFAVPLAGDRFWVKRSHKNYKNVFQRVLYPNLSALRDEARAMRALRALGMLVPTVVCETPAFIVLTDLGENLQHCLDEADGQQRLRHVAQLADVLSELHRRKGWHGNAALRNFTLHDGQVGMLDFEKTAHRWWSLNVRQAYDIWQLLHSLAQYPDRRPLTSTFLERYRPTSRGLLYLRLMSWGVSPLYLLLAPFGAYLKRDFRQAVSSVGTLLTHR
jgi:tRNA A-37 threonylcarbamoyl transferase component Bud32